MFPRSFRAGTTTEHESVSSGTGTGAGRATIVGRGRVIEEDPHGDWERLIPVWQRKEPAIVAFLKARVALPLFFERALIEIVPLRILHWPDGQAETAPAVTDIEEVAA